MWDFAGISTFDNESLSRARWLCHRVKSLEIQCVTEWHIWCSGCIWILDACHYMLEHTVIKSSVPANICSVLWAEKRDRSRQTLSAKSKSAELTADTSRSKWNRETWNNSFLVICKGSNVCSVTTCVRISPWVFSHCLNSVCNIQFPSVTFRHFL